MRFSVNAVIAALPALAAAQENPLDQYKAQFQNFLGQMGSCIPNPGSHDPIAAAEAKAGSMKLSVLTLDNWKETLYESVAPDATTPEEWWVLTTGGNKTCYGRCDKADAAFNETAAKFALLPSAPHMAVLNCDDQPILCNAWSTGAPNLFVFDMLPPPAHIDVYKKRLNYTTVTSDELVSFRDLGKAEVFRLEDPESWFHPFHGKAVQYGLAVPIGYTIWAFNLVPNWLFMLVVSLGSRTMMSNRMQTMANRPGDAPRTA